MAVFKKSVFPNGLTLVSEQHSGFRSLSMGVWVKTGTRYERAKEAGVSHFLEHMLFKGTDCRNAYNIICEIEHLGGDFNAFTDREYTCFHIMLQDQDYKKGAEILVDILLNSTFDASELERERKVILQEIAMVQDNPEELAADLFLEKVYGRHGLGRQILGSETSIRRLRRGDLIRYFRRHYRPDQVVIAAAGGVSHAKLRRAFRSLGRGRWPGRPARHESRRQLGFQAAPRAKDGFWSVVKSTEQIHIVWGVESFKYNAKDRFACILLNVYLGGGMSSLLYQEIREKRGLAYDVYSSLSPFIDSGLFTVYLATSYTQASVAISLIEDTVSKLRKDLLTEDELQKVKDNLKGTIWLGADDMEMRMSNIAKNEVFFGQNVPISAICERIDAVTPRDIRRVARKLFIPARRSVLAVGPKDGIRALSKKRRLRRIFGTA